MHVVFQYSVHNIVKLEWSYDSATPTRLQASLIMRWRYLVCGQHDSQTALRAATFRFLRLQSAVCDSRHVRWVTALLDVPRTRPQFVIIMLASFPATVYVSTEQQ